MLKIRILAVGTLKEPHWADAVREFEKRLHPYMKLLIEEVAAEPLTPSVSAQQSMKREAERILKRLPKGADRVVALDRMGKRLSSQGFADRLKEWAGTGTEVVFVIGGAAGLDRSVLERCDAAVSLSDMTFTHEMARVFLLEQLYRAVTIIEGKKYHY